MGGDRTASIRSPFAHLLAYGRLVPVDIEAFRLLEQIAADIAALRRALAPTEVELAEQAQLDQKRSYEAAVKWLREHNNTTVVGGSQYKAPSIRPRS